METIPLISSLFEKYDLLDAKTINLDDKIKYLKDRKEYKCRFCHKEKPEVKFKNKAHLIPEFFGNKTLFSLFECDNCNEYFGQLETEFANFMLPYNSIVGTKGKRGIPKYKKRLEISSTEGRMINIKNYPNELSATDKQFDIPVSHEYIPDSIYRSLIKICLSIVDEKQLESISYAIPWILDKERKTVFPAHMLFKIYPFVFDQECIRAVLLKKKTSFENIPSYIFSLSYKNFSFQTHFPEKESYNKIDNYRPFPCYIPNQLDSSINTVCEVDENIIELFSIERIKHKSIIQVTNLDGE